MKRISITLLCLIVTHFGNAQRTYHKWFDIQQTDLTPTSDSGNFFVGYTNRFSGGDDDIYITRLKKTGQILFSRVYGTPFDERNSICLPTRDSGFVIFSATGNDKKRNYAALFIKCSKNGRVEWAKRMFLPDSSYLDPVDAVQTVTNNYVLLYYKGSSGRNDFGIIVLSNNGLLQWHTAITAKIIGGEYYKPICVLETPGKKVLVAGNSINESIGAGSTATLMQLSKQGVPESFKFIDVYPYSYNQTTSAMRLVLKENQMYLFGKSGYYTEHYYLLPLRDKTNMFAVTVKPNVFDLQHFLKTKAPFALPLKYGYGICYNSDGTYSTSNNGNLFRYDSLNRICPNFGQRKIDTSSNHKLFKAIDVGYSLNNDSLTVLDCVIKDSAISEDKTICSAIAPMTVESEYQTGKTISISLSPNPAKDFLRISGLKRGNYYLRIIDKSGTVVCTTSVNNQTSYDMDISRLSTGFYYLLAGEEKIEFLKH